MDPDDMNLNDLSNAIAARTDTDGAGVGIGAAETKRVLSQAFQYLAGLPSGQALQLVGKWMSLSQK